MEEEEDGAGRVTANRSTKAHRPGAVAQGRYGPDSRIDAMTPSPAASAPAPPSSQAPRCYALVPCAGTGSRAGSELPKQYVAIAGRAMVAHTLEALARVPRIAATLVVLAPDDDGFERHVPGFASASGKAAGAWIARCGGATRAMTVFNGLAELAARGVQPHDWVLVHDAARCLVRAAWIDRLIDACEGDDVGGLLALPLADTLKQEGGADGRAAMTLERKGKWLAQTPQMFRCGRLAHALKAAPEEVTDEAGAVEALGLAPRLVRGSVENLKVTWAEDFGIAERLLQGGV
jgi:2-C-methyl-D-erythritol 4-phosphate cytidylyltransferase